MIPELAEIDQLFMQIQDYIDTPYQYWQTFTPDEAEAFEKQIRDNKEKTSRTSHLVTTQLHSLLPRTSPTDIIEAFNEGSRVLRLALGGYIFTDFHEDFVPLMIDEIKNGTSRLSSLFLQSLTDHWGVKAAPLIIEALDNRVTQEQAIHSVDQLKLVDAIPKLREIAKNGTSEISSVAQEILADFSN